MKLLLSFAHQYSNLLASTGYSLNIYSIEGESKLTDMASITI